MVATITYPEALTQEVASLYKRWFMTPNYLSNYLGEKLMTNVILPQSKKTSVPRHEAREFDQGTILDGYGSTVGSIKSHHIEITGSDTTQTLKATNPDLKHYYVHFVGNDQKDALSPDFVKPILERYADKNHIFKNYPGVGTKQTSNRVDPLIDAGYEQIKALLKEGIPAEKITLYGFSLGGGVAAAVASKLHDEGHCVNLIVDRSFSSLGAVPSARIKTVFNLIPNAKKYEQYLPLATSVIACGTLGFSLGTALAGIIKSIGILVVSLLANLGYYLSLMLSFIPGAQSAASTLNAGFNVLAHYTQIVFDVIASVSGALVGLCAGVAGTVTGLILGAFLSLQSLVSNKPVSMPLNSAASMLLNTTTGELHSVSNIQHILSLKKHGHIKIINSIEDKNIVPDAALNTGIGLSVDRDPTVKKNLGGNIHSVWYNKGDHGITLKECDIMSKLTHIEPAM